MSAFQGWIWQTFTGFHTLLYRASGGRLGSRLRGFNVLLLTTVGRKSGKRRTLPLGYIRDGERYIEMEQHASL